MSLAQVSLDDKYRRDTARGFLNGTQALVRLLLEQRRRDAAAGLDTAGFVSGYRGSPLGGFDQALWRAGEFLDAEHIHFQPGVNEDLGATAVWGSQQVGLFPGAQRDGVFGLWYGKGPGVDRSGDVFKHANCAGTAPHGGVLAVAGDDHACKSSTLPHQSEYAFMDAQMPVLNPAGVQELLDLGLLGFALSRFSGCWVGCKTTAETLDSSAVVDLDPARLRILLPEDFQPPAGGLHIRWPDQPMEQELRLQRHKLYAALAFARANRLDRVVIDSPRPRLGIVTCGKAYLDVLQALEDLGIDAAHAAEIGLRVYKVAMSWPLERNGIREFAEGLDELLVIEEKRALIENQLKEQLYNWRDDARPRVVGKFDECGEWILPSNGELSPARIARVIARRIARFYDSPRVQQRLAQLEAREEALSQPRALIERRPHFCSGCPHNSSTKVPEGSRALAGIGCHYMATWMDRRTETFTQMGGEGASWVGQAPFTSTAHVFVNLGDGTYYHSGLLAIRQAVAAGVNITYKLLYNDAVAMTGGQPVDGQLDVPRLSHQLRAEGVQRIVIVSDEPEKYAGREAALAGGCRIYHRRELDAVQRQLRDVSGVSALIYDQTCAAEKRRRRKRGKLPDPPLRAFINARVCEGCGDCGEKSSCLSLLPLETEFGRKREIDQSACNKDFSCLDGFCPSFVTVRGGSLKKPREVAGDDFPELSELPEPQLPPAVDDGQPYDVLITGVGGTGVVTIGALLGMAAHLDGKAGTVLDMTGLAQKFGAVISHLRIADEPAQIHAPRIAAGNARLLLGCDLVVAASFDALAKLDPQRSVALVNDHASMPAAFTRDPDLRFPAAEMAAAIRGAAADSDFFDATRLATQLLGDAIASNLFSIGYAWQRGLLPLSAAAIERAIELNGVAVDFNKRAFLWGRRAAHDRQCVERLAAPAVAIEPAAASAPPALETLVERRAAELIAYQGRRLARRYRALVERVGEAESRAAPGCSGLAEAVAENYFKLLARKDEYEVARLYSDGEFQRRVAEQFEGDYRLEFHLAPPLLARRDAHSGEPQKRRFGPWMLRAFGLLAKLRWLRGTPLDPFGYQRERRVERALIRDYERLIDGLLATLDAQHHALAVELAALPAQIRGFGHVKAASVAKVRAREAELRAAFAGAAADGLRRAA